MSNTNSDCPNSGACRLTDSAPVDLSTIFGNPLKWEVKARICLFLEQVRDLRSLGAARISLEL